MTETTPSTVIWLTQAKYDELKAELEELRGPRRAELVKRVSDARDEGDRARLERIRALYGCTRATSVCIA